MNVKIYSRKAMEKLIGENFPEKTAVISFYDPVMQKLDSEYRPVDYQGKPTMLMQIPLFDTGEDEIDDYDSCFPEAEELAKFIRSAHENRLNIICQCDYGQSRSAGCAAAILEYYHQIGLMFFLNPQYSPSKLVFDKVFDALQRLEEL